MNGYAISVSIVFLPLLVAHWAILKLTSDNIHLFIYLMDTKYEAEALVVLCTVLPHSHRLTIVNLAYHTRHSSMDIMRLVSCD